MKNHKENYILVVAAVFYRQPVGVGQVAIFRRSPGNTGSGYYEFPGGKVESGETEVQALNREIVEELGIQIEIGPYIGETYHQYPSKNIHLRFYWVADPHETFQLTEHDDFKWVAIDAIEKAQLSEGDREIIATIIRNFPQTKT